MSENTTTSLLMQIIERYSGAIASFIMVVIALYYNRKTLRSSMKDRERPRIVELLRFCIVPLEKWLEFQLSITEPKEFNMEQLFENNPLLMYQKLDPKLLCVEFNTLLEKLRRKDEWDEKVIKYNELSKEWSRIMIDLKRKLEELLDNNSLLLKDCYEKTEAKNSYTFDNFKRELINSFFYCYKNKRYGRGLSDVWCYVGDQLFATFENKLSPILIEINKLMEESDALLRSLIDLLENICERLREDYQLTPSEQTPLIEFEGTILRK